MPDDLLPFNVLVAPEGARLIDWEFGGILPYPTSLARLLAHGSEDDTQLFVMQESDRQFAIDYYYTHLISQHGISYPLTGTPWTCFSFMNIANGFMWETGTATPTAPITSAICPLRCGRQSTF